MLKPCFWIGLCLLFACQPSMERQPKIAPLEEPRSPVEGTVPYSSRTETSPRLSRSLIERGKERYEIYCSVCHGLTGAGDGMATQRGFGAPPPFRSLSKKDLEISRLQSVIAQGSGRMSGFSNRIPLDDRFAVASYVQVLHLRSHFPVKELNSRDLSLIHAHAVGKGESR